jgi:hypothetical protein
MIAFSRPARMTVAECLRCSQLSPVARSLPAADGTLRHFFDALMERELHADAIQVLPHLLPKRAAVWWGALCAWQANRAAPPALFSAALEAALNWVYDPGEEKRQAAEAPAKAATMHSSAGCLAWAAFWSGGSMAAPELPTIVPPPQVTAVTVGGAVLLACVEYEPLRYLDHYRHALDLGIEIAQGRLLWTPSGTLDRVADPQVELLLGRAGASKEISGSEAQS